MRLNIIDPNTLDLIGVLTQYESVQWSPTFNTPDGAFQINCSTDYIDLLQNEYLIENTEELDHVGVIKKVQTISSNQKTSLQINGIMLERDIFYKRIVKAWIVYQDMYPTDILNNIIGLALTEPPEPERKLNIIGKVTLPKAADVPDMGKIEYSANYPNLGDEVFNLIQNLNLGVKARINRETQKIDVEFYIGSDYTFGSDDPIVFSPERGTVLEVEYTQDSSQNITHLLVLGEGNVKLEAERETAENEPLIEKSLDLSNDCKWPTYKVEKPNEEGGTYYRYKKYNPPADFITNRDVWEKYAVDRIETEETRYREVEVPNPKYLSLQELMQNPELGSGFGVVGKSGAVVGSPVPVKTALENALNNGALGRKTTIGTLSRFDGAAPAALSETEESIVIDDPNAVKPPSGPKLFKATKKRDPLVNKIVAPKTSKSGKGAGLSVTKKPGTSSGRGETLGRIDALITQVDGEGTPVGYEITETLIELEEYQVTIVTYETKDFLEYVYVNPGAQPSESSKIVQGSFASGDAIYYEHFEDVKVEESKYREVLLKKAKEYLKTFVVSKIVAVKPYYLSNLVYNKNYSLGDIVTARNSKLGYTVDLRVTQVNEVWDSKGYNIDIVLGDSIPSLTNRIKLLAKGGA